MHVLDLFIYLELFRLELFIFAPVMSDTSIFDSNR